MKIKRYHFTKQFIKRLSSLSHKKQLKVKETLILALEDVHTPRLRLHELKGEYCGMYSISAGGNLRIHF